MEITGKVFRVLPLVTGQGRNGEWRKQEFVIEIESGQFPKKLCLSLWGDKIEQSPLNEGEQVALSTMTAIGGRMAAYTGREIKWQWLMEGSKLDIFPKNPAPGPGIFTPVPIPGSVELV